MKKKEVKRKKRKLTKKNQKFNKLKMQNHIKFQIKFKIIMMVHTL